ncbi:MAG: hypothetical protein EPN88_06375 [Bacteroidetes bacterium]|nr:MAG: hypothetical protein EPN88_06375 [Bacteroidota bacterium]
MATSACSQKVNYTDDWIKKLKEPEEDSDILKPENFIEKYKSYNFSSLFIPKTEFIGFIGLDYRRIMINFISIKKDSIQTSYKVVGNSLVLNNKCDFIGTIKVRQIREFKTLHFGVDDMFKDKGIKNQGLLIGDYSFKEKKAQSHSGEFIGVMTIYWYIDKNGVLCYDNIESYSDSYRNNQYIGIWKDYSTKNEKTCNWGEYRIPYSGDLDIGAGEFSPNKKYYNKGWKPDK